MLIFTLVSALADDRALVSSEGWDQLDAVGRLQFTFIVDKAGAEVARRTWDWTPRTGAVVRTVGTEKLPFTLGSPTSDAEREADAQLINDLFWLAPPLQLRWTEAPGLIVTARGSAALPVGEGEARQVELRYAGSAGGYTPGDAYDVYLDPAGHIVAWSYRKGGGEVTLSTSFERWVDAGPLHIATDHRAPDGSLRVQTTDVSVTP